MTRLLQKEKEGGAETAGKTQRFVKQERLWWGLQILLQGKLRSLSRESSCSETAVEGSNPGGGSPCRFHCRGKLRGCEK